MVTQKINTIFDQKKRRVVGEMIKADEVTSPQAWLSIHGSSKEQLVTYESRGLVAAVIGSGSTGFDHPQALEASLVGRYIASRGGYYHERRQVSWDYGGRGPGSGECVCGYYFP